MSKVSEGYDDSGYSRNSFLFEAGEVFSTGKMPLSYLKKLVRANSCKCTDETPLIGDPWLKQYPIEVTEVFQCVPDEIATQRIDWEPVYKVHECGHFGDRNEQCAEGYMALSCSFTKENWAEKSPPTI